MTGFGLIAFLLGSQAATAEPLPCQRPTDDSVGSYFVDQVWAKVGQAECLKCHTADGDASDSQFLLKDVRRVAAAERDVTMRLNRDAFTRMAMPVEGQDDSVLLQKVVGKLDHGGEEVLKNGSAQYRILETFVHHVTGKRSGMPAPRSTEETQTNFFDGVRMLDDRRLLRRATLSLAGRLPSDTELAAVEAQGVQAIPGILDDVLREEAFYVRLREGFNDIFLTQGIDGNPDQTVLSYEHFEKTRGWYQHFDLSHIADEKERRQAGYKLANDYRAALRDEPMQLIDYIVRHDRPFSEIITADYIMVSPYTARGYGIYEELKDQFQDTEDPFEFIPVKLKALVGRSRQQDQDSETGFYPHAGILSTFQYLSRYPTTETNRNRLRARMYYQHFLGVDVLELAPRVADAAAVSKEYENPTMEASECVVCHKTVDPVAGAFQDYWRFDANFSIYGRRKEGWFTDMFSPGFEGEQLPEQERWRALQWLGEQTVKDHRFAVAMVEHAYYLLNGRRLLLPPKDIEDPLYDARYRAYQEQRKQAEAIANHFVETDFDFKQALKDWILSDFYRADGLESADSSPQRAAELHDLGVVRMLAPEQLERKIEAVFGKPWGRLEGQTAMLYGGIDSHEVTERATDPSGAMGAIQRTMANDVACRNTALDFSREPDRRLLFPEIELDVLPGTSPEADHQIRNAIVHLHRRILGRYDAIDSAEVDRTLELFTQVIEDAAKSKDVEKQEIWSCRQNLERPLEDPHYTLRAWRAVITYLLRRPEFLYE